MTTTILSIMLTLSLACGFTLEPLEPIKRPPDINWQPSESDVVTVSQTVWGEYRGDDETQRAAVVFCICNRVDDDRFPDTIEEVVTQEHQFHGYSPSNPSEPFADEVRELLVMWHNGESWLDPSLCWFSGDGRINHYRDEWETEQATLFWP